MKTALAIAVIVILGATSGFMAERAGAIDPIPDAVIVATLDEVPYSPCPGDAPTGVMHRGDRVFATGRSNDSAWVQFRAPYDTSSRVWIESQWVTPDTPITGLVVLPCPADTSQATDVDDPVTTTSPPRSVDETSTITGTTSAAGTDPSTTNTTTGTTGISTTSTTGIGTTTTTTGTSTTSTTGSTTTSIAGSTTTTTSSTTTTTTMGTSTTSTTTTSSTTTTTTVPSDQDGPTVLYLQSTESDIWEDGVYCGAQPRTATISVIATDPSGVANVDLFWSVGTSNGTAPMGNLTDIVYSGTVGLFADSTVSSNTYIFIRVTARDTFGNSTIVSSGSLVLLHDCVNG